MELHTDLKAVQAELKAAEEKIFILNDSLVTEHEDGFYKALCQAEVLLNVEKPFELGFNLYKNVYEGVLMDIEPPSEAAAEPEAGAEVVAGSANVAPKDAGV